MLKTLYIIRHGETELNRQGVVQGRGIDSDLNETGRAQAAEFFTRYRSLPFQKVYTSTLKRTHQTVQGFIEAGLSWEQYAEIDELAWGEWEGRKTSELAVGAFRDITEKWQSGDYDAHFPGGESPREVAARLERFISVIKSRPDEELALVCMHGRSLRILMCLMSARPISEMYDFPHQNTGLYIVTFDGQDFELVAINNTDHLKQNH